MELIKDSEHLRIPFQDIEIATKNFTTLIGKGGFGNVYKGELPLSGKVTTVAVKRLDASISGQGFKEFLTEIHLLSRYKHPNLVSLLGFCQEGNEKILIYEYAEHGSFDKFLCMDATVCPITCKQKIDICIDAASGLDYLHNHAAENERVIHRDIKSANILLDHNWKAMISDLGLSKLGRSNENETFLITNPCGTRGYCDPMYMDTGVLTKESDVYSFGVVLFEVLCRRLCFMNVNNEQRFLPSLARRYYKEGNLHEIIDPAMKQLHLGSLNRISEIAYQCLLVDREKRPSMCLVVQKLKEALKVHEIIDGSPTDSDSEEITIVSRSTPSEHNSNEELTIISRSPRSEHNSNEEQATSFYILRDKARKATRMHDHDDPYPVLEPNEFMKLVAKGTNMPPFTSNSHQPMTSPSGTTPKEQELLELGNQGNLFILTSDNACKFDGRTLLGYASNFYVRRL